ncbi:MAG: helix-turn-helix transcriptional regulator [Phycisphaerae bacterium]|nr:helix-turn-helix transcriptional regulator [Phycisphaerae bacterium]
MPRGPLQPGMDDFHRALNPWVLSASYQPAIPDWENSPRDDVKTYFDMWYIPKGAGAVRIDGKWHPFAAGDLVTIKPGEAYQQERSAPGQTFELYYVFLQPFGKRPSRDDLHLAQRWPRTISFKYNPTIKDCFARLFEIHATQPRGYRLQMKALALQILSAVLNRLETPSAESLAPAYPRLLRARQYIERHYAEGITLGDIAEYSDLSPSYLSALFKRHFRASPVGYLIDYRIRMARMLLARGASATTTAQQVGFASLHYFSRMFTRHVGITPSRYAASCKKH